MSDLPLTDNAEGENICWAYTKWSIRSIDKKLYDNKIEKKNLLAVLF